MPAGRPTIPIHSMLERQGPRNILEEEPRRETYVRLHRSVLATPPDHEFVTAKGHVDREVSGVEQCFVPGAPRRSGELSRNSIRDKGGSAFQGETRLRRSGEG